MCLCTSSPLYLCLKTCTTCMSHILYSAQFCGRHWPGICAHEAIPWTRSTVSRTTMLWRTFWPKYVLGGVSILSKHSEYLIEMMILNRIADPTVRCPVPVEEYPPLKSAIEMGYISDELIAKLYDACIARLLHSVNPEIEAGDPDR